MNINKGFGFVKSHSSYVSILNNWFTNSSNTAGYIYIVRDPRDVTISWAKHANLTYDGTDLSTNSLIVTDFRTPSESTILTLSSHCPFIE